LSPTSGPVLELPVLFEPGTQGHACQVLCQAGCCKYYSLQIDTPRTDGDFDDIRWYLMHEDTHVYKYEGAWYLMVLKRCRHLTSANLCDIYDRRPRICSEYDPSDCEFTGKVPYDLYFRSDTELEAWLAQRPPRRRRKSDQS
jgi:Fe-S-cluster containining protein